ncbi:MAG: glycosyltransferase [Alphaproteobacteria bacterium]|nr:glycosyltransferase [Alphaproteobacteria bacterium]
MNILMTAFELETFSGVPCFTRDLATALTARGHRVAIHTLAKGAIARDIEARDIAVVSDLGNLPFRPDIIHGQHQPALLNALTRFEGVPAIFAIHDATQDMDAPLPLARIARHVAVDRRCEARIRACSAIPPARIAMICNAVDLNRFRARAPLPATPRRALIFSNYAGRLTHMLPVLQACKSHGLDVDVVGSGVNRPAASPEDMLGGYDLVFAKARCALEAMATGTAVILCDFSGLGPMVSTKNLDALRPMNFGAGVLTGPLDAGAISGEIARYDAADAARVSARIRQEASLDAAAEAWLSLYQDVLQDAAVSGTFEDRTLCREYQRRWRLRIVTAPVVSALRRIRTVPVVGETLFFMMRRVWHAFIAGR